MKLRHNELTGRGGRPNRLPRSSWDVRAHARVAAVVLLASCASSSKLLAQHDRRPVDAPATQCFTVTFDFIPADSALRTRGAGFDEDFLPAGIMVPGNGDRARWLPTSTEDAVALWLILHGVAHVARVGADTIRVRSGNDAVPNEWEVTLTIRGKEVTGEGIEWVGSDYVQPAHAKLIVSRASCASMAAAWDRLYRKHVKRDKRQ